MTRMLGLDVGERRVGVAVGDPDAATARPLATFIRGTLDEDAEVVARLAAEQHADVVVIGLPLMPSGTEGEQARLTRDWADGIVRRTGLAVSWRDERFTTADAERAQPRLHRERGSEQPTRAAIRSRRVRVDLGAAVRILQAEIDGRAFQETPVVPGAAGLGGTGVVSSADGSGRLA
jgi:putative holliday junction resolvase